MTLPISPIVQIAPQSSKFSNISVNDYKHIPYEKFKQLHLKKRQCRTK